MHDTVPSTLPTTWLENVRCVAMGMTALSTLIGSLWLAGIF